MFPHLWGGSQPIDQWRCPPSDTNQQEASQT